MWPMNSMVCNTKEKPNQKKKKKIGPKYREIKHEDHVKQIH